MTYGSSKTNLHHIWDTNMPEQYAGGHSLSDAEAWAKDLTTAISSGKYKSDAAGWLKGTNLSDPVSSGMAWASDANAYVCSTVMPDGVSPLEGTDLSIDYYNTALPVIELQFAKAGYRYFVLLSMFTLETNRSRLAAWLNLLATGSTEL